MSNPKVHCRFSEMKQLESLVEHPKNPNKHPDAQLQRLSRIIELNGWRSPIVISNRSGFVIKGHGRLQAAKLMKWTVAPVEFQDYKNEAEEYADMIADNKIAEASKMDNKLIDEIISELGDAVDMDAFGLEAANFESVSEDDQPRLDQKQLTKCPKCGEVFDHAKNSNKA